LLFSFDFINMLIPTFVALKGCSIWKQF